MQSPVPSPSPVRVPGVARLVADNLEELVAVLLLVLIGMVMATQVLLRTAFSAPLSWPEELSQFMFVWASTLGAVGAAKRFGLVRVTSIVERFPAGMQRVLDYLVLGVVGVLLGVLGWQGWQMTVRSTYAAATLPITWAWMYSAAAVFAALIFARVVQAQVFRYRFEFIETVLARRQVALREGGSVS